jgi:hypothetical protein
VDGGGRFGRFGWSGCSKTASARGSTSRPGASTFSGPTDVGRGPMTPAAKNRRAPGRTPGEIAPDDDERRRRSRGVAASGEHGTSHPVACRRGFACPGARNRLRVPSGGLRGRGGLGAAHRRVGRPLRGDSAGHCVQSSSHQRDSGARSAPSGRPESFAWPGDRARSAGTRSTPCGPAFRGDQRDVGGIRVSRPKTRRLARTRRRRPRSTDDVATSSLVIQIDCRPPPTVSWSPKHLEHARAFCLAPKKIETLGRRSSTKSTSIFANPDVLSIS